MDKYGDIIIAGADATDNSLGGVFVFQKSGGSTWSEVGNNPLQGTGYVGTGVHEGVALASSADGTTLLMTGEHDDNFGAMPR